jgi:hypothetical protein
MQKRLSCQKISSTYIFSVYIFSFFPLEINSTSLYSVCFEHSPLLPSSYSVKLNAQHSSRAVVFFFVVERLQGGNREREREREVEKEKPTNESSMMTIKTTYTQEIILFCMEWTFSTLENL